MSKWTILGLIATIAGFIFGGFEQERKINKAVDEAIAAKAKEEEKE